METACSKDDVSAKSDDSHADTGMMIACGETPMPIDEEEDSVASSQELSACDSESSQSQGELHAQMMKYDAEHKWYLKMDEACNTVEGMQMLFECDPEQFYLNGAVIQRMLQYRFAEGVKVPDERPLDV